MTSDKAYSAEKRLNALITRLGSGFYTQTDQSAPTETDGDSDFGTAGASYTPGAQQQLMDQINDLKHAHNNLVNGSVTSLVNRLNQIQDMLRSAGMMG